MASSLDNLVKKNSGLRIVDLEKTISAAKAHIHLKFFMHTAFTNYLCSLLKINPEEIDDVFVVVNNRYEISELVVKQKRIYEKYVSTAINPNRRSYERGEEKILSETNKELFTLSMEALEEYGIDSSLIKQVVDRGEDYSNGKCKDCGKSNSKIIRR